MKLSRHYEHLGRFLGFLLPYRLKGIAAFLFMLLSVGLQLPLPFLSKYLIDQVVVIRSFKLLNMIGLVLIGVIALRSLSGFAQDFLLSTFRGRVIFDIRRRLFEQTQKASLSFYHKKHTGYLVSRLSDDVNAVRGLLADTLISAIQNILTFVAGVICTIYIHPLLALICFLILPFYLISIAVFNGRIRKMSHESRESYAIVQKELQELLSAASVIKAFSAEGLSAIRFISKLKKAIKTEIKLDIIASLSSICSGFISSLGPLALIWYGCGEIMRGNLTVGGLLAFTSFVGYLFGPVRVLYGINIEVQKSLAAAERVFSILDIESEHAGGEEIIVTRGKVSFRQVSFSYEERTKVLNGVSFEISPGKTAALVGRSGSGKTTIAALLLKFYQPEEGQILVDGKDIRFVNTRTLRKSIGFVAQEAFLFTDSIIDNIRFGLPTASDDEVIAAAKMAYAHDFIKAMPNGYATIVGERGCTLSGGQRQRLAIARAILKNPKILILDEATSQVDNESERLIQAALVGFMKNRTTIIIAHRLSTIQKADKIFLLERGKIVEQGTQGRLLKKGNIFTKLYSKEKPRS